MHFDEDIKPLFREGDRSAMRFAFDLWSPHDVSTHADAILRARRRLPSLNRSRQARIDGIPSP